MASPRAGTPSPTPLNVGDVLERYEILKVIGQNSTSVVYRVRHQVLGTDMALKVLKSGHRRDRQWLMAEARAQARLRHPNIVGVTDVITVAGEPALVMELVDGPTLAEFLAEAQPSIPVAVSLFGAIVRAVRHAHDEGMVHRDLKPSNVLMTRRLDEWVVKVADFGLVKSARDGHRVDEGYTVGTPYYMAPEQIYDPDGVDARADMWALGVIFYQLCTGKLPFMDASVDGVFKQIRRGNYTAARKVDPTLPFLLDDVISDLLEPNRDDRISDCDTLLERLREAGFPVETQESWRTSTRPRVVPKTGRETLRAITERWRDYKPTATAMGYVGIAVTWAAGIGWLVGFAVGGG